MFAVIETGGKQYKVSPGQVVEVEKFDLPPESEVDIDRVLLVSTDSGVLVGQPFVQNAVVKASIESQFRGPKIIVFKYKSKKRYRRTTGHRQNLTKLFIQDVLVNGVSQKSEDSAEGDE